MQLGFEYALKVDKEEMRRAIETTKGMTGEPETIIKNDLMKSIAENIVDELFN